MTLKYIMTVGVVIFIREKGHVIAGTVEKSRIMDSRIKDKDMKNDYVYIGKINDSILVKSDNSDYKFEIKNVKLSPTFIGNTTIGILVYDSENIHHIKVGDRVYAIIEDK